MHGCDGFCAVPRRGPKDSLQLKGALGDAANLPGRMEMSQVSWGGEGCCAHELLCLTRARALKSIAAAIVSAFVVLQAVCFERRAPALVLVSCLRECVP